MYPTLVLSCTLALSGGPMLPGATSISPTVASLSIPFEQLEGTIASVDDDNDTFVLTVEGKARTLKVDENTEYSINGKKASRKEALKVGATASVTVEKDLAMKVAITQ